MNRTHPGLPALAVGALLFANPGVLCQQVAWVDGASVSALTLRVLPESNPQAGARIVRQGLALLPIEITNRTAQQSLRDDVAHLATRGGLRRVELPDGGRLFSFREGAGTRWGLLHVAADGTPRFVLERAGIGATGLESPFADRIGVAPDGRHAAVTTTDQRLLLVRLDGGTFASTQAAWRDAGVTLVDATTVSPGANVVFCGTDDDRVLRVAYADGSAAVDLTPPSSGARVQDEFCLSADGRTAAFLHGPQQSYSIWLAGETGAARRLPPPPAKYEEPGYLPDQANGPRMLLNDDATRLMYTDAAVRDEIYWLDTTGATPTTHVTSDANFQPYIGIGVFPMAFGASLALGVGDPAAFDVFAATTATSTVANWTRTNGNTTLPFATGALTLHGAGMLGNGAALVLASQGPSRELLQLGTGIHTVAARGVRGDIDRGTGRGSSADFRVEATDGDRWLSGVDGAAVLWAPPGILLSNSVAAPGDLFRVGVASVPGQDALVFRFADGSLVLIDTGEPIRDAVLTNAGLVLDGTTLRYLFAPSSLVTLPTGGSARWVLSGAGTQR